MPENICGNLVRYGLSDSAAPYLNFECAPQMERLENGYFYLGYTGNGDLICLNRSTENIVILEHEIYNIDEDEDEDYEYDKDYRLVKVTDSTGAVLEYGYDSQNQRVSESRKISDTACQTFRYCYDAAGRMTELHWTADTMG